MSATTKFLWLKVKHPIVIYDSRARIALKAKNDYFAYYKKWRGAFTSCQSLIRDTCLGLYKVHMYAIDQKAGTPEYIKEVSSQSWFHERVFDSYLWHGGNVEDLVDM